MTSDTVGRRRACDDVHGAIVWLVVVVGATAFSFRLTSFLHAKEAVLCLGLVALVTADPMRTPFPKAGVRFFLPLWILLAWCAMMHLAFGVAQVRTYTAEELARLATVLLLASFAFEVQRNPQWRERILDAIALSAVLVATLALVQLTGWLPGVFPIFAGYDQPMYSVFGNQDALGGYLAVGVCVLVHRFLQGPRFELLALGGLAIAGPALVLSASRSAWLAACIGVALVVATPPREWRRAAVLGIPGLAIAAAVFFISPTLTLARVTGTFAEGDVGGRARRWFWDGAARMFADAPIAGVGLGNFQYFSPEYQARALHAPGGERHYSNDIHTLHAHCDPIEIAAETGMIGLALAAWMLWSIRKCRGPEWGAIVALIVFGSMNAVVASAPHLLAGLLLAGSLASRRETSADRAVRVVAKRRVAASLGVGVAGWALAVFLSIVLYIPSYRLRAYEREIAAGTLDNHEAVERLARTRWPYYPALEALGAAKILQGEFDAADEAYERAHRGLDSGRVWYYHGLAVESLGDRERAREMYEACLWRWPRDEVTWERLLGVVPSDLREPYREEMRRWLGDDAVERLF